MPENQGTLYPSDHHKNRNTAFVGVKFEKYDNYLCLGLSDHVMN